MSDDSKNLSRVEDLLNNDPYLPKTPMSRVEKLLEDGILPKVTPADNGKILKVKDGEWETGEDISGDKLPPVSSADNGKVLKVVDAEWNIGEDEGDRLPFVTGADEGKVLKVNDQGHWEAEEEDPELPATTSADEGKILKVDSNGDWSKGDAVKLISLTSSQYEALSSDEKNDENKLYFIKDLDPNYTYVVDENISEKIVVRIGPDGTKWFFSGYEFVDIGYVDIPSGSPLYNYVPGWDSEPYSANYPNGGTVQSGWVGFYRSRLRSWNQSTSGWFIGATYSVVDANGSYGQKNPYEYPYIYSKVDTFYYKNNVYKCSELPSVSSSDNGKILKVTEGQWAKGDAPTELPSVSSSDNGKILKVTEGNWAKGDAPSELPAVSSSDNGKILKVDNGAWAKGDAPSGLPSTTASDAGKILKVNSTGDWAKGEDFIPITQQAYDALPSSKNSDGLLYFITDGEIEGLIPTVLTEVQYEALTTQQKNDPTKLYFVGESYICYKGVTYYEQPYVALTQAQYDALPSSKLTDGKMYYITDQDGNELPDVTASDNGKVLKVVNGAWDKGDVPTELPSVSSSDNGKVLKVNNGAWAKADETVELPSVSSSDNGKVLKVVSGAWAKGDESGKVILVTATDITGSTNNEVTLDYTYDQLTAFINNGYNIIVKYHLPNSNQDQYYHLSRNNVSSTPDWASIVFEMPFTVSNSSYDAYNNILLDLSTPEIYIRPLGSSQNPDGYTARRSAKGQWAWDIPRVPDVPNTGANKVLRLNSQNQLEWDYSERLDINGGVVGYLLDDTDEIYQNKYIRYSDITSGTTTITLHTLSEQSDQLDSLHLVRVWGYYGDENDPYKGALDDILHNSDIKLRLYADGSKTIKIDITVPTGKTIYADSYYPLYIIYQYTY